MISSASNMPQSNHLDDDWPLTLLLKGSFSQRKFEFHSQGLKNGSGVDGTQSIQIGRENSTVGINSELNTSTNNLYFDNPLLSKKHAEINYYKESEEVKIKDLGSTNGTYVNDFKLKPYKEVTVYNLDFISIGGTINDSFHTENGQKHVPVAGYIRFEFRNDKSNDLSVKEDEIKEISRMLSEAIETDEKINQRINHLSTLINEIDTSDYSEVLNSNSLRKLKEINYTPEKGNDTTANKTLQFSYLRRKLNAVLSCCSFGRS